METTLTIYRKVGDRVVRRVVEGCFLTVKQRWQQVPQIFMVVPGEHQMVFPGDRILQGIGGTVEDWEGFIPSLVPGLLIPTYAKAFYLDGQHHHTEAGN